MELQIRNVSKDYRIGRDRRFTALREVNLDFQGGELISILGESGSGKSTLMNLLGGLDRDYLGEIRLNGQDIHQYSEKELDHYRRNRIGFIFQSFNLIPHLSVLDNVTIAMTLSGASQEEREKRAREILEEVGLGDQIRKKPSQLSGGQKQRVAIARALINDPDIILADEPTGSLDTETSAQILEILRKIPAMGKLVIMVTHSQQVAALSSRIIRISDGRIVEDRKVTEPLGDSSIEQGGKGKKNKTLSFLAAIRLALKNMAEKPGRNILVSLGASIGITSVILMLSIGSGMKEYMTSTMNQYVNPLVVEVNMKAEEEDGGEPPNPGSIMMAEKKPFEEKDLEKLAAIPKVSLLEKAWSSTSFTDFKITAGEEEYPFQNLASLSANIMPENIAAGTLPGEGEILVAASLFPEDPESRLGDEITLTWRLEGEEKTGTYRISGLFGEISTTGMENFHYVYMNYQDLEALAGSSLPANTVYLSAAVEEDVPGIKESVADLGYEGSMEENLLEMFTEMLDVMTYILTAIAAISLVVSAIMILVVLYISVVERTREIGVLKAIGARRKDIRSIFLGESFLIGLLSGLAGVISALLLGKLINTFTQNLYDTDLVLFTLSAILFGLGVSITISILAGISPAARAARLDPVESLRRE